MYQPSGFLSSIFLVFPLVMGKEAMVQRSRPLACADVDVTGHLVCPPGYRSLVVMHLTSLADNGRRPPRADYTDSFTPLLTAGGEPILEVVTHPAILTLWKTEEK
jgi:hypothetical protein